MLIELGLLEKSLISIVSIGFGPNNVTLAEISVKGVTSMVGLWLGGFAKISSVASEF